MQAERPAIVANVTMNEAAQLRPVLPVETGNVIAIDVGKLVLGHDVSTRCRRIKWRPVSSLSEPLPKLLAAATDRIPSLRFAYGTVGIAATGGLAPHNPVALRTDPAFQAYFAWIWADLEMSAF
jgi:hypothetical protein